jgi:hypothetical protein
MKHFFTGGSQTALVRNETCTVTANIREHSTREMLMRPLPPPATFAEGQRFIYGLLASAAGMFCGAAAMLMIALLMWGGWSPAEEHSIVVIFGWSLGGFIAAMVAVIVGLLAGGPVGRFKMTASKDGASFEANSDTEAQP